jgi:putative peptidoglycan lipid II flippase
MSLMKSTFIVGFFTFLCRISGLIRDMLFSAFLGATGQMDIFLVAFKTPNFFRKLFAEGAFSAAFVPIYTKTIDEKNNKAFAQNMFIIMIIFTVGFVLFLQLALPYIIGALAPGFAGAKLAETISVARFTLPYLIFMCLAAFLGGILNSHNRFAAVATMPIILNIWMVFFVVFRPSFMNFNIWLGIGILIAGFTQFLFLFVVCWRHDIRFRFLRPRITPTVKRVGQKMLPGLLGAGVYQLNVIIDTAMASRLASGSISYLHYADRFVQLPLAVIGIALGTALLPSLSHDVQTKNTESAQRTLLQAVLMACLLAVPSSAGLWLLGEPIMAFFFERGAFTSQMTTQSAAAMSIYALGLTGLILNKVYITIFFANQDTKTPFYIASFMVIVNLIGNIILMRHFAHVGLAMSTAIASWVQIIICFVLLKRFNLTLLPKKRTLCRIFFATFVMMIITYCIHKLPIDNIYTTPLAVLIGFALYISLVKDLLPKWRRKA